MDSNFEETFGKSSRVGVGLRNASNPIKCQHLRKSRYLSKLQQQGASCQNSIHWQYVQCTDVAVLVVHTVSFLFQRWLAWINKSIFWPRAFPVEEVLPQSWRCFASVRAQTGQFRFHVSADGFVWSWARRSVGGRKRKYSPSWEFDHPRGWSQAGRNARFDSMGAILSPASESQRTCRGFHRAWIEVESYPWKMRLVFIYLPHKNQLYVPGKLEL